MKKVIIFATGILLFLSSFAATASAKTPDMILPENTNLYMKVDPANINETFASYYEEMIGSLTQSMFSLNYYFLDEDANPVTDEYTETQENFTEIFSTNPLHLAFVAEYDIDGYLDATMISFLIEISESEYEEKIIAPYLADNSTITEFEGVSIYETEDIDGVFVYYEGYMLFADEIDSLEYLIGAEETLSANSEFSNISEKFLSDSFFELYVGDIQIFLDEFYGMDDFYETLVSLSALESMGFSMKETSTGYEFQSYVNQDSETLAELNIDYNNMDPVSLHKHMPNENPIFYSAKNNNADLISMIKNDYEYEYAADELYEELHLDLDELLFALENETALLVQDSGELFPTATLMTQLGDNKEEIQTQVDQFVENSWDAIIEEAGLSDVPDTVDYSVDGTIIYFYEEDSTVSITKETVDVKGATLDRFTIKITPNVRKNPYALILDPTLLEFKITIGITGDNVLLISSNKDIENSYDEGLENNSDLEDLFENTSDAVSYLSVTQINDYLQNALNTVQEYLPEEFNEVEKTKSVINTLLEPWGVMKETDTITNDYMESEASIIADIEKIIENYSLEKLEEDFDASAKESGTELIFNDPKDFSDVDAAMWYGDNVYFLTTKGIVDGHPDGTYKPEDTLNRVEFIKLVVETLENEGVIGENLEMPGYGGIYYATPYTDIEQFSWYDRYVTIAFDEGLFEGLWEDDTELFPNNDLTRIEAAKILSNVLEKYDIAAGLQNADEMAFTDVATNDTEVVKSVFLNNIMVGTSETTFSPNKVLNRAEAASIIRNLLNIL